MSAILEGAVQRDGDQIRITVQLIDAREDKHIWATTYDRNNTLQNMFSIQSDIASSIAEELQAAMSDEDVSRVAQVPTRDTNAYVAYVRGNQNLDERSFSSLQQARVDFERAIALDPSYAKAHTKLAETLLVTLANHKSLDPVQTYDLAGKHLDEALRIDPGFADAHATRGLLEMSRWEHTRVGNGDQLAAVAYSEAIRLNPNFANAYIWFATLKADLEDFDGAVELLTQALMIDPLRRIPYVNLPGFLAAQGQNNEAIAWLLEAISLFPDWESPYQSMSNQLLMLGRLDEAIAWGLQTQQRSTDPMRGGILVPIYQVFGDDEAMTSFGLDFPQDHPLAGAGAAYWSFITRDYKTSFSNSKEITAQVGVQFEALASLYVNSAILIGEYQDAYDFIVAGNPSLGGDSQGKVTRFNVRDAILLAYLHQQLGRPADAAPLLDLAWPVIRSMPRLGMRGHGIRDVYILLLQGDETGALDALEVAVDEGFTINQHFNGWPFIDDPFLDAIRDQPRFAEIEQRMNDRIEQMRISYEEAKRSGDWEPILAKAGST